LDVYHIYTRTRRPRGV